jgi:hypothetical protein
MADIRLFRVGETSVTELDGRFSKVERTLQTLIEAHLEALLGVRLIASEHPTGERHGGRIDTLGLDGTQRPVIIEYKRDTDKGHFTQILDYLSWLRDHRADFQLLTQNRLGVEVADQISWSYPRLLCVAGDFTDRAQRAVREMDGRIELIRYRHYGDDLLMLERLNTASVSGDGEHALHSPATSSPEITARATPTEHVDVASIPPAEKVLTQHKAAQLAFWVGFVDYMAAHRSVRCPKPRGETYMNFGGGRSGFQFPLFHSPLGQLTDNPGGELRVQLEIRGAHASEYYTPLPY